MASLCKPPDPLSLTDCVAQNWRDFEEQLKWYLAGTEVNDKADSAKIGIMLSQAGKEARDVYKRLSGELMAIKTSLTRSWKHSKDTAPPKEHNL